MDFAAPPPDSVGSLARRLAEGADRHDRAGTVPHDAIAALREAGLLALTVPRRHLRDVLSARFPGSQADAVRAAGRLALGA